MKKVLIASIFVFMLSPVGAQEFIGMTEKSIMNFMTANKPEMAIDNNVRNSRYKYLKYLSDDDKETWVIFINEKGLCRGVRITCANSCYEQKVKELNDKYKPAENNLWSYRRNGTEITVRLKQEPWFFTVTHERANSK